MYIVFQGSSLILEDYAVRAVMAETLAISLGKWSLIFVLTMYS
jgi:hypothetical protein